MAVPRPRVVCPSCSTIHEQTGSTTVCPACLRRDDDRDEHLYRIGARAGVNSRGDFNAVFRDPTGPFARGFRLAFFRDDPAETGGFPEFARKLRDLYAERLNLAQARNRNLEQRLRQAEQAALTSWRDGYEAGQRDAGAEAA